MKIFITPRWQSRFIYNLHSRSGDINNKNIGKLYLRELRENIDKIREEGFHDNLKVYLSQSVKNTTKKLPPALPVIRLTI